MKINELEANKKVINLVGKIVALEDEGESENKLRMQEGFLEDDTGQVKLTLWGGQTGIFSIGDKVIISTGWCKEFEGDLQVSTGKYGKIAVVPPEKVEDA